MELENGLNVAHNANLPVVMILKLLPCMSLLKYFAQHYLSPKFLQQLLQKNVTL